MDVPIKFLCGEYCQMYYFDQNLVRITYYYKFEVMSAGWLEGSDSKRTGNENTGTVKMTLFTRSGGTDFLIFSCLGCLDTGVCLTVGCCHGVV